LRGEKAAFRAFYRMRLGVDREEAGGHPLDRIRGRDTVRD